MTAIELVANIPAASAIASVVLDAPIAAGAILDTPVAAGDSSIAVWLAGQVWTVLRVALGIGLVIFVHELGHFAAAKMFGVKCEKFYVGFDPPMPSIGPIQIPSSLGKFQWGETEYGIGILPLGGYVKMLGQDDDPRKLAEQQRAVRDGDDGDPDDDMADTAGTTDTAGTGAIESAKIPLQDGVLPSQHPDSHRTDVGLNPRSFQAKAVWQRMIIMSAGVVMNVITGVLFAALAFGLGVNITPSVAGGTTPGGPAWNAGMQPGGRVVAVGRQTDPNMSFRQMSTEIMTTGLKDPDGRIPVSVDYGDRVEEFELELIPAETSGQFKRLRLIGVAMPRSEKLGPKPTSRGTVAAAALGDRFAGATIESIGGVAPDLESMAPMTPVLDHLYENPRRPLELKLRTKIDGTDPPKFKTEIVTLPPQPAKTLGFRFGIGKIKSLVRDGPADRAGVQIGDRIERVDGAAVYDPFELAADLVGRTTPVTLTMRRGQGSKAQMIDISIDPIDAVQSEPPPGPITDVFGLNALGLAYEPSPQISRVDPAKTSPDDSDSQPLRTGDFVRSIKLIERAEDLPEAYRKTKPQKALIAKLREGLTVNRENPVISVDRLLQSFPEGSRFRVYAFRGKKRKIVQHVATLTTDPKTVRFDRGLDFQVKQQPRRAASVGEALKLGVNEGADKFREVTDFLGMAFGGRLALRDVGGPLTIFTVAKSETELGLSRLLMFLTLLSMNLAILNFLPIPALDGGHMVFLLYELIRGKRPNEAIEYRLTIVGVLFLLTLMVVVFAQDILRLIG